MRLIPILLIALATTPGPLTTLRGLVENKDFAGISALKQRWEVGWEEGWRLLQAELQEIDHFYPGIVLTWERTVGSARHKRIDAFDLDGKFYWGHESTVVDGLEVQRGPIEISADGQRLFRVVLHLGPNRVPSVGGVGTTQEVLSSELHVFKDGKVASVYRSKVNFQIGPEGLRFVPPDAELVSGAPVPLVEQRRSRPPSPE